MNLKNTEIKDLVLQSITQSDFEKFIKEYFDKIEAELLNEDDSMGGGGEGSGNTSDGVLDDQLFRSAYLPGWEAFDLNGQSYADIVGYTLLGHTSVHHTAKTGNVKIPVLNPREENGPAQRVMHPSKGEDYAKEKADKWEMYPFNQRPGNIFTTPDVAVGAGAKSNFIKEAIESNKEENEKILKDFVKYCVSKLKLKETPNIEFVDDRFAEQKRALGAYDPQTKTIVVVTQHRMIADIMRTLAHELVHRKQDELGLIKNAEANGKTGSPTENVANAVAGIIMRNYGKVDNSIYVKRVNENLLMEGGAAGHLAHPFEDEALKFSDMKEMIKRGLIGGLDKEAPVSEKLDGQNIAFSIKNGNIVFGRNKGHVRNGGENALDVQGIAKQFAGRGGIEKAFTGAAEDLHAAVSKLKPEQVKQMFGNGSKFMSLEIILPDTTNVIPYGKSVLVMHGTIQYDKEGNEIGRSTDDASAFAKAVQKVGADKQKTFGIEGPKTIAFSDADTKEYAQKAKEYSNQLTQVQKQFGLNDKSKLEDYRRKWWLGEINRQEKELGIKFSPSQKKGLINRWADGDKSFGVKGFEQPVQQEWFRDFETNKLQAAQKQMIKPIESVFLNAGAQSLKRVTNFLAANNPGAADDLRKETLQSIKGIKDSKDVDKIAKLQTELERLNNIGMNNIVPSEGVVFQYNGKPYKFTGAFAPINQINGTFKFDKPKKNDNTNAEKSKGQKGTEEPTKGQDIKTAAKTGNKQKDELPQDGVGNTVAIFTGRFQPFHAGHYSIYEGLVNKFGKENVFIASSNAQDPIKSPFPFKDKKEIMTTMFGIPKNRVVQVKNPYSPVEILDKFPKDTKYVTAVSQKDAERLSKGGGYFKNFDQVSPKKRKGYEDEGYYIVAPEMQLKVNGKNISGTQLRATFGSDMLSIPEKKEIFKQVYPKFDKDVFTKIVATTKRAEKAKEMGDKKTKVKQTPVSTPKLGTMDKLKSKLKSLDPKTQKRVQRALQTKIKNPVTGNTILVKSALKYDDRQAVKKMAVSLVKQAIGRK
jgi:cytidyltransferase-like protein